MGNHWCGGFFISEELGTYKTHSIISARKSAILSSLMNPWIKRLFFLTVFCTGAAVLIVEVSAVRLLAPYYGSSLYVLSSVLSVILFALSVGYYAGGKMADRFPYHIPLYIVITSAGLVLLCLM